MRSLGHGAAEQNMSWGVSPRGDCATRGNYFPISWRAARFASRSRTSIAAAASTSFSPTSASVRRASKGSSASIRKRGGCSPQWRSAWASTPTSSIPVRSTSSDGPARCADPTAAAAAGSRRQAPRARNTAHSVRMRSYPMRLSLEPTNSESGARSAALARRKLVPAALRRMR